MAESKDDSFHDVRWSPRVSRAKIRRLYESTCEGVWDEALIDDVGMTLYMRCRDIMNIHRAQTERNVICPRCQRQSVETQIARAADLDELMTCPVCKWAMSWRDYHGSFARRQLNPGGAIRSFQKFMEDFAAARDATSKMLAIDLMVHGFHYSIRQLPDQPTRAAGVNLIEGKLGDVVEFLNELSGLNLSQESRNTHDVWRKKQASIQWDEIFARKSRVEQ